MKFEYSQPDFYHFSDDSIKLVDYVINKYSDECFEKVLDLCAGCGIIGIEYILKSASQVSELSFIEENKKYESHLLKNIDNFVSNQMGRLHIEWGSFNNIVTNNKFDLILSNPPYYNREKFRMSDCADKKNSRSFTIGFMEDFIRFIQKNLTREGMGFFVTDKSNEAELKEMSVEKECLINENTILYRVISFE